MSFTVDIQLRCDGCGVILAERRGLVGQDAVKAARWNMARALSDGMLMTTERVRRRTAHLCHGCADRAPCETKGKP